MASRTKAGATTLLDQAGLTTSRQADLERAIRELESVAGELQSIARHFTGGA